MSEEKRPFVRPATGPSVDLPGRRKMGRLGGVRFACVAEDGRRRYILVPTLCFNCEAACGLLAYVDKETLEVRKFEGNPVHPGSRGRNCAKGPATLNQVTAPDRMLYPAAARRRARRREVGARVVGRGARRHRGPHPSRAARESTRRGDVPRRPARRGRLHAARLAVVGHRRPQQPHERLLGSRAYGYAFWMGDDRPSPDYANARCILLISAHLETGHYFNPHAQRIMEGKQRGAKLIVIDTRLSNTASQADYWLSPWPGSEAAILLAIAKILVETRRIDREFLRRWVNWEEYLRARCPGLTEVEFEAFLGALEREYAEYTPEFAERESGVSADTIRAIAEEVARAGTPLSSHVWRSAAAGNLGGWQVARALFFLNVLTGSVGTPGGRLAERVP